MDVLGDAISRDRRSSATALRVPTLGRDYDYRRFCTNAWKVGNFLRHHGVRGGATVAIADDPVPETVLSMYGAALLGAVVRFVDGRLGDAPKALVVPESGIDSYTVPPETRAIVYGARPADPSVAYFERDVWSENPTEPPDRVAPADPLLSTGETRYTHREVLDAATTVIDDHDLNADTEVAVQEPFTSPGVVVAGLIAPIVAGGTAVVGPGATGDVLVDSDGDVRPESVPGG